MARAAKATTTTKRTPAVAVPKKKMGRPVGSKNRVIATAKPKAPPAVKKPVVRRAAVKAAPAPVKMNKAELEAQVVKLERALTRAKTQNAELKAALKDVQAPAKAAPVAKATPTAAKTTRAKATATPAKPGRKPKAKTTVTTPEAAPVAEAAPAKATRKKATAVPAKRGRKPKVESVETAPEAVAETGTDAE